MNIILSVMLQTILYKIMRHEEIGLEVITGIIDRLRHPMNYFQPWNLLPRTF